MEKRGYAINFTWLCSMAMQYEAEYHPCSIYAVLSGKSYYATPAITATLGELGWLPCNLILNRHRVKYFCRLKFGIPDTRLCKQVFTDMESNFYNNTSTTWCYFKEMRKIFVEVGLDHAMQGHNPDIPNAYKRLSLDIYKQTFDSEVKEKTSLSRYKYFKTSTFAEKYMYDMHDFEGTRLKFKARTGCLGLQEDLARWGISDSVCNLCNSERESIEHFLFICPTLQKIRVECFSALESQIWTRNPYMWESFMSSSLHFKVRMFLGNENYLIIHVKTF